MAKSILIIMSRHEDQRSNLGQSITLIETEKQIQNCWNVQIKFRQLRHVRNLVRNNSGKTASAAVRLYHAWRLRAARLRRLRLSRPA